MDNIDQIILGLLKDNARMSVTELAEKFTFHGQRSKENRIFGVFGHHYRIYGTV